MMKATLSLKPGDIIKERPGMPRCIIDLRLLVVHAPDPHSVFSVYEITPHGLKLGSNIDIYDKEVEIIALQELTPAQQHAEELLRFVSQMDGSNYFITEEGKPFTVRELLEKIDPPQPPTLDEALKIAHDLRHNLIEKREADGLLNHARRAGMLP